MKNLTYILTLLLIITFPILESCNEEGCGTITDYYDYSSIEIEQPESSIDDSDRYIYFVISPIINIQANRPESFFGSSLMADNLILLPKFDIENIKISSDKPFDLSNPDQLDITEYFEVSQMQEWVSMDHFSFEDSHHVLIRCISMPDNMNLLYDLTIKITKSNGEVAKSTFSNLKIEP